MHEDMTLARKQLVEYADEHAIKEAAVEDDRRKNEPDIPSHLLDFSPGKTESCTDCGACCALVPTERHPRPVNEDQGYVELLHSDFIRMGITPQTHEHLLVKKQGDAPGTSGYFLKVLPPEGLEGARCPFLEGEVHWGGAKCGIYEQRPNACRVFERNSVGCVDLRKAHYFRGGTMIQPRYVGPSRCIDGGRHLSEETKASLATEEKVLAKLRDYDEQKLLEGLGEPIFVKEELEHAPYEVPESSLIAPPEYRKQLVEEMQGVPTATVGNTVDMEIGCVSIGFGGEHRIPIGPFTSVMKAVDPAVGDASSVRFLCNDGRPVAVWEEKNGRGGFRPFLSNDELSPAQRDALERWELVPAVGATLALAEDVLPPLPPVFDRDPNLARLRDFKISPPRDFKNIHEIGNGPFMPLVRSDLKVKLPQELYIQPGDFSEANKLLLPPRLHVLPADPAAPGFPAPVPEEVGLAVANLGAVKRLELSSEDPRDED